MLLSPAGKPKRQLKYVILDAIYEIGSVCISSVDVVSDVLITITFYEENRMVYFWTSIAILGLAQIAYTGLFVSIYGGKYRNGAEGVLFCVILPIGQLVPVVMWGYDKFERLRNVLKFFNLAPALRSPVDNKDTDPLLIEIRKKIRVHGGFVVESMVESIPQSILQMVAIVQTGVTPALSVFSIVMSMTSVASRGFMLSYSVDRPTFVFQFLCFVADVFSIFCTVSWLCFVVPGEPLYSVFWNQGDPKLDLLSALWFQKDMALICSLIFFGILIIVVKLLDSCFLHITAPGPCCSCPSPAEFKEGCRDCLKVSCFFCRLCVDHCGREGVKCPCTRVAWAKRGRKCHSLTKNIITAVFIFLFGVVLACVAVSPALIIFEGVRFSLIPLVFMQSTSAPRAKSYPFYRALYNFLDADSDFVGRLKVANKYMASITLEGKDRKMLTQEYRGTAFKEKVYFPVVAARRILALKDNKFTLRAVRHANGNYIWRHVKSYFRALAPDDTVGRRDPLDYFGVGFLAYVLVPLVVAIVVYSIIYPIVSFIRTPVENMLMIQLVLTGTYMVILFLMLCLSYHVYKFDRVNSCLVMSTQGVSFSWIPAIEELYSQVKLKTIAQKELKTQFPRSIAELIADYLPEPAYKMQALADDVQNKVDQEKRIRYAAEAPSCWRRRRKLPPLPKPSTEEDPAEDQKTPEPVVPEDVSGLD